MATRKKARTPGAETPEAHQGARKNGHGNANKSKTQSVTALRLALLANAYEPIPIKSESKRPGLEDWTNIVATKEIIQDWEHFPGTGVLTRRTPAIDLDIKDEEVAQVVEDHMRAHFNGGGRFMRRVGQPPKRAFLFKTETPFAKMQENFLAPDGSKHKLEILGDGQQVIVDGIHPDINKPYTWFGGTPWEVPAADLPLLTKEQARAWLDEATALLVKRGWRHVSKSQTTAPDDESGVSLIVQLACRLWGEPTDSNQGQFRFGTHGSKSVDAVARPQVWFDFEANVGGN